MRYSEIKTLGEHRVMCGDATSYRDVSRLVGDDYPQLIFLDPPWDMDAKYVTRAMRNIVAHAKDAHMFLLASDKLLAQVLRMTDYTLRSFIVFKTTSIAREGNYLYRRHILAAHFTIGHPPQFYNVHKGYSTIIEIPYRNTFRNKVDNHEKPMQALLPILLSFTKKGDLIVDLFAGSGSMLIAAEHTGRRCYCMEINCEKCEKIIKRYEEFTQFFET